ncbi:MAG: hypothetical protein JO072_01670 [Parafilimonas sp.]|nr:hypothetical protein [Parafilimonas sp.]
MKTRFYAALIVVVLAACTKTNITPSNNLSASSDDLSSVSKAEATLTAHPWMYNAFYMNYIDKNHMGDPLYVRGAQNNQDQILATDRFTFKTNHHFVQTEGNYVYKGTWHFSGNVPTTLFMKYDWGTDEDSIVNLDAGHLNFIQSFGYHNDDHSYTELVPAK